MKMKKIILIVTVFVGVVLSVLLTTNAFKEPITEVSVLMYHNVIKYDEIPSSYKYSDGKVLDTIVSTEKFEHQMDILKKNNIKTLKLDEFERFVTGKKKLYRKSVLITFDDGMENNYTQAYPILEKNHFNAVVFLITSYTGKNAMNVISPFPFFKLEQIEQSRKTFEFACHTHDMHNRDIKRNILPDLLIKTDDEIRKDLKQCLSYDIKPYFAYPFGKYKSNIYPILQELEVKAAFTVKPGAVKVGDSVYDLKRNGISENTTDDEFMKIIGIEQ